MALVAYGSDVSDSEDERRDSVTNTKDSQSSASVSNILNILPQPSKNTSLVVEEEDDEFLHKKETPTEKAPKAAPPKPNQRKPVRIVLPSLAEFNDDDDDDDDDRKSAQNKKKPAKGTGLLSMLPQPKFSGEYKKEPATKLIPRVLKNPPNNSPTVSGENKKAIVAIPSKGSDDSSEDEDDKGETVDFFSLDKKEEIVSDIIPLADLNNPVSLNGAIFPDDSDEAYAKFIEREYAMEPVEGETVESEEMIGAMPEPAETVEQMEMDIEALKRLYSNRERRKQERMDFIDINQRRLLPDAREWLTKSLTEDDDDAEATSSGKRKGEDQPTGQQKRKHQITYLAHQAKVNEKKLQKEWAQNRMTRKQTQSKYGF